MPLTYRFILILVLFLNSIGNISSQNLTSETDTAQTKKIKAFAIEDLGSASERTLSFSRKLQQNLESEKDFEHLDSLVNRRLEQVKEYQENIKTIDIEDMNFRQTESLRLKLVNTKSQIDGTRKRLVEKSTQLGEKKEEINLYQLQWQKTLVRVKENKRPAEVIDRVQSNLKNINDLDKKLTNRNNLLLRGQDKLTGALIYLDEIITNIDKIQDSFKSKIYTIDSPPLWALFSTNTDSTNVKERITNIADSRTQDLINTKHVYTDLFISFIIIVVLLFGFTVYIKYRYDKIVVKKENAPIDKRLYCILHPMPSIILLSVLFLNLFFNSVPTDVRDIYKVLLIVPLLGLTSNIYTEIPKRFFYLSALVFFLSIFSDIFTELIIFSRLIILSNSLITLYILGSLLNHFKRNKKINKDIKFPFNTFFLRIGIITISLSIIINAIGNSYLSSILFRGTVNLIFGGILLLSASEVLKSYYVLIVRHKTLGKLNTFEHYPDEILKWLYKLTNISIIAYWLHMSLNSFMIYDSLYAWLEELMVKELALGSVAISLGNVFAFFITLTIALYVSKFIRFILNDEIFTHFELPRGVPGAVSMIVRLILIAFGFVLAFGAAEIDISNITIIFGALGVGIGFGLQNIFNNLVSGLILAFERPVQVGDILQISNLNLMGEVKEIGIRASTVRTFDGAEVIVPNGNLISNEMINWTLSDRRKRQELLIGVSYGTDTTKVLQLLEEVVGVQEGVLKKPAPFIIFKGFGDSSLDFRVLFWTAFDYGLSTKSRVGVAIDKAFKEAGITIPFPQRDLHFINAENEKSEPTSDLSNLESKQGMDADADD
ncbi:mechanosensitive ion channel family protein [Carboxylicivirga sp. N1Y90]|uniref:mechanosensitive ion channel family protein n=1 Tax=Carboxylicivirga fragile TaxID=3417571 RepID=UPI003D34EAE8|nr:mechanosensitive ion channel [Marinilabiliaceae bacterium N1Y90]